MFRITVFGENAFKQFYAGSRVVEKHAEDLNAALHPAPRRPLSRFVDLTTLVLHYLRPNLHYKACFKRMHFADFIGPLVAWRESRIDVEGVEHTLHHPRTRVRAHLADFTGLNRAHGNVEGCEETGTRLSVDEHA